MGSPDPHAYSNWFLPSTQFEGFSNPENQEPAAKFHDISAASDCESGIVSAGADSGFTSIHEGDKLYEIIKKKLVSGLDNVGLSAEIEAIHKKNYASIMSQAKFQSFSVYLRSTRETRGGNPNVKYAWFGASKKEINSILSRGFDHNSVHGGSYGHGIYLSPSDHPAASMQMPVADDDGGLRYLLLCRVILGRTEFVRRGSEQCNPSSEEFDSGVDNLVSPTKYIIWSSRANSHVLPEFVISFRTSSNFRGSRIGHRLRLPKSAWIPFPELINELSKFLPLEAIQWITKHRLNHIANKITRRELILQVRSIAGDELLVAIIRAYRNKAQKEVSESSSSSSN